MIGAITRLAQVGMRNPTAVYDETHGRREEYLVSVPVVSPTSSAGVCTRGYWAVRLTPEFGEVVFLKDTWRLELSSGNDEGTAYRKIQGRIVNIPKLHAHGQVVDSNVCSLLL